MKCIACILLMYSVLVFAEPGQIQEPISPNTKMFSLSSDEMLFASKLSDVNRRRFCYKFSLKERSLAMLGGDSSLSPDERVENVFSSFYE